MLISRAEEGKASEFINAVAFWSNGEFVENVRYAIHGTPCKEVLDGNIRFYSEGVQELFPEDEELKSMDAEGYLGCPILSSSGQCFGYIAIFDTSALENEQELISIIRV